MTGGADEVELVVRVAARLGVEPPRVFEALNVTWGHYQVGAVKRGRDARWPFVPLLKRAEPATGATVTQQVLGLAYATRGEAVEAASLHLVALRRSSLERWGERPYRADRVACGLPRDVVA